MAQCLELAQRGKGNTTPNPMVGAVLVHNDKIIGEGLHHFYGSAHAEVNCLDSVAEDDKYLIPESTMYVNLEPCAHTGITPPCANRLAEEKVKRVVIANKDPFEKVSGRGIAILDAAGIEVVTGVSEQEGLWVNRRFFCYETHKRPYIILKWAQTADGFMAPTDKSKLQITGQESMELSHKWRTEEAAIMVGYLTALHDNPNLTARLYQGRQPLRITLDRNLTLPETNNLFNSEAATWILNEQHETVSGNIHYIRVPFDENMLHALLIRLYDAHITSIIVEGGAELHNSFIDCDLWDEARIFTANEMNIGDGIPAPELKHAAPGFEKKVGKDTLALLINQNSDYPYVTGMEL